MFEDLLGRDVNVSVTGPAQASDVKGMAIAVYTDQNLRLSAVLGLDLPLAANAGAALGLLPPGAAEDAVDDKALAPNLAENVKELCNIFTGLLNREDAPHLRLYQFIAPGEQVPTDVASQLIALGQRLDLEVEVTRYGTGRLALSVAL
ncbi:hypothetical protein ACFQX7_06490 [Luedemannella flava]